MTRLLDIALSALASIVFLPFGVLIAVVLRLTGEGEVFYTQERIGKDGRPFRLLKFATMLKNSSNMGTGDVTVKDDPRVLPFGKFLRKTKLNEVPQLLNILVGHMSVVGPRPQTPKNFSYFPPESAEIVTKMRPGLTGIGSIVFRDEESIVAASPRPLEHCFREEIGPYKGRLEQWYYHHQGLWTYLLLIIVTAWVVIVPRSRIYRRIWKDLPPAPEGLFPPED